MLPPITRKYKDLSTGEYFMFAFYCDDCGSPWTSEKYPYSLADAPPRSEDESKAHAILYKAEHDAAYERSNTEALFHFSRCPKCGSRVCDDCFSETEPSCVKCGKQH